MNIKTRTGNHQQTTPQAPYFYHFFPEDIVEELEAASMGHAMWRSIFRDPHGGDWNVALFQARLIFESVVGKAAKKLSL